MTVTQDQLECCLAIEGAYYTANPSAFGFRVFHTWADCPAGRQIGADDLTCGKPEPTLGECHFCREHHRIYGGDTPVQYGQVVVGREGAWVGVELHYPPTPGSSLPGRVFKTRIREAEALRIAVQLIRCSSPPPATGT